MPDQPSHRLVLGFQSIPLPTEKPLPYLIVAFLFVILAVTIGSENDSKIPEMNPPKPFEFTNRRLLAEFLQQSRDLMVSAKALFGRDPYKIYTEWGSSVVLAPEFMDELRNDPRLNFKEPATDDSHGYIPGFEPFNVHPALAKVWHQINPREDIVRIISRLSTRVFMGEELCRNEDCVRATGNYTTAAVYAGAELNQYPRWARPFIHWFFPSCWGVRSLLAKCRKTLKPHLERRNALVRGDTSVAFDDSIQWYEQECKDKFDPATEQISMSLVAIHTTSDLLQQTMLDLTCNPELFGPLREELVRVLRSEGLNKTALYNLKLMDSVIKESQRLKPALLSTFRRLAKKDIKLSNGFVIRKGQKIMATNMHMWDAEYYENATKYDGYRFLKMRDSKEEKNSHLVSASTSQPGFGHGQHACPGRFFAANEVKIALAHLLLKYDWKLPEGYIPRAMSYGMVLLPDPGAMLIIRRRKEELELDC
ncbi:cytochrome P450 [Colletotrichum cereale]|nr:cytochrome P450 [Colletotrichum cereale]